MFVQNWLGVNGRVFSIPFRRAYYSFLVCDGDCMSNPASSQIFNLTRRQARRHAPCTDEWAPFAAIYGMDLKNASSVPGINHAPMLGGSNGSVQGMCRTLMWHQVQSATGHWAGSISNTATNPQSSASAKIQFLR
eukprot:4805646-Amphidinium_carterae.1